MSQCSESYWTKWFWEEKHKQCISCQNKCYQSSKVDLNCSKYLKK